MASRIERPSRERSVNPRAERAGWLLALAAGLGGSLWLFACGGSKPVEAPVAETSTGPSVEATPREASPPDEASPPYEEPTKSFEPQGEGEKMRGFAWFYCGPTDLPVLHLVLTRDEAATCRNLHMQPRTLYLTEVDAWEELEGRSTRLSGDRGGYGVVCSGKKNGCRESIDGEVRWTGPHSGSYRLSFEQGPDDSGDFGVEVCETPADMLCG